MLSGVITKQLDDGNINFSYRMSVISGTLLFCKHWYLFGIWSSCSLCIQASYLCTSNCYRYSRPLLHSCLIHKYLTHLFHHILTIHPANNWLWKYLQASFASITSQIWFSLVQKKVRGWLGICSPSHWLSTSCKLCFSSCSFYPMEYK